MKKLSALIMIFFLASCAGKPEPAQTTFVRCVESSLSDCDRKRTYRAYESMFIRFNEDGTGAHFALGGLITYVDEFEWELAKDNDRRILITTTSNEDDATIMHRTAPKIFC